MEDAPWEKLNSVCLAFAIAAYACLVGFGMGGIEFGNLIRANWWGPATAPRCFVVARVEFRKFTRETQKILTKNTNKEKYEYAFIPS